MKGNLYCPNVDVVLILLRKTAILFMPLLHADRLKYFLPDDAAQNHLMDQFSDLHRTFDLSQIYFLEIHLLK